MIIFPLHGHLSSGAPTNTAADQEGRADAKAIQTIAASLFDGNARDAITPGRHGREVIVHHVHSKGARPGASQLPRPEKENLALRHWKAASLALF
ncbi:hypothetical protein [Cereibacter sphaeroides]|uniref:hypothetical protein n=1 Tax=Cereibacter sphaeroides TaxID=1063 RepID=UPI001558DCF9|nr:hypothetical protein [Cereibacter sphaeroides]